MTDKREDFEQTVKDCRGTDGINVSRQTVTRSTDHLPDDQKGDVRWVYTVARDNNWNWKKLEEWSGIDSSTWYRVFHDRYINSKTGKRIPLKSLCAKIKALRKKYEQRAYRKPEHPFIETSVWERVEWLCDKAVRRKKMGFIYGESHIGKTECMLEYQRRNNHGQTAYFELPPSGGVQLMTRRMARSLHVTSGTCFDKMIEYIIAGVDDDMLLLVDQVHRIFYTYQRSSVMRCLDVLMYVHDQTGCPMVLCGTNIFRDNLQEGAFFQYLKQLRRRGLYELQLPDVAPRRDLDMISRQYGLPRATGEAEKLLLQIAKRDGLAMVFTRLEDAIDLAGNKKQKLSWEHFVRAVTIVEKMAEKK